MKQKTQHARPSAVPTGRIARLGRLGAMTAGIAGNMAMNGATQLSRGQRPSMRNLLLTPQNITKVADQLAKMRGAAMKIGQLMSMDTGDVLPPELAQIMARLRDDAHFMPPAQLKQVLNAQWPEKWLTQFKTFNVRPIAAASIGQVHRAQLKDGRDLAIKVQYPGVAKSIDSDVANVGALMRMSGLLPKGFDLAPYLEEGRKQLHQETDYRREAAQLMAFADLLSRVPQFAVPSFCSDWSTPAILAMSYMEGISIDEIIDDDQIVRDKVAYDLIDLTLHELFAFARMQTDPNFANYLYNQTAQQIVLLDFGATRTIDSNVVAQYRRLMRAGQSGHETELRKAVVEIGFIASDTKDHHSAQIVEMIRLVFQTLHASQKVVFSNTDLSQRLQAMGMALADDGFVPPPLPIDVLLVQRKFGGMFLLAARLKARVDVLELLDKHINNNTPS